MECARQRRQAAARLVFENHLIETETAGNAKNFGKAENTHGAAMTKCKDGSLSRIVTTKRLKCRTDGAPTAVMLGKERYTERRKTPPCDSMHGIRGLTA